MGRIWEGEDITNFLINLEPWKQGTGGMPIKEVSYHRGEVTIRFFSPGEMIDMGYEVP